MVRNINFAETRNGKGYKLAVCVQSKEGGCIF